MLTSTDYTVGAGALGRQVLLNGAWNEEIINIMMAENIEGLIIHEQSGGGRRDLSFLSRMAFLKALMVADRKTDDISGIHCLHGLRHLEIRTFCKTPIDFKCFPSLEICCIEWRPGCESLFQCASLKRLYLDYYKGRDSYVFRDLKNLECLILANGPMPDVKGLSVMLGLKELWLLNLRKLDSLAGIENLPLLWKLFVDGCGRISRLDEIACVKTLRILSISNDREIESLRPIAGLPYLQELYFIESTNILDGDMEPINTLPRLGRLGFANRRHYNHKCQDFWQSKVRHNVAEYPIRQL